MLSKKNEKHTKNNKVIKYNINSVSFQGHQFCLIIFNITDNKHTSPISVYTSTCNYALYVYKLPPDQLKNVDLM